MSRTARTSGVLPTVDRRLRRDRRRDRLLCLRLAGRQRRRSSSDEPIGARPDQRADAGRRPLGPADLEHRDSAVSERPRPDDRAAVGDRARVRPRLPHRHGEPRVRLDRGEQAGAVHQRPHPPIRTCHQLRCGLPSVRAQLLRALRRQHLRRSGMALQPDREDVAASSRPMGGHGTSTPRTSRTPARPSPAPGAGWTWSDTPAPMPASTSRRSASRHLADHKVFADHPACVIQPDRGELRADRPEHDQRHARRHDRRGRRLPARLRSADHPRARRSRAACC